MSLKFGLEVGRGEVADGAVETAGVIELCDGVEDLEAGLVVGDEVGAVHPLVLEGGPEGLHGGVIVTVALAAHGGHEPSLLERSTEVTGGILDATIGVKDEAFRGAAMGACHGQGILHKPCVDGGSHGPADDAPAAMIHDGSEVEPVVMGGLDVGDVGNPDLVGTLGRRHLGEAVGGDGVVVVAVGGPDAVAGLLATAQALGAHEPGDASTAVPAALRAQAGRDARAAVSAATLVEDACDVVVDAGVLLGAVAGMVAAIPPCVVAGSRDIERLAKSLYGMIRDHRVDGLAEVVLGSGRIPKAFFRMSRCSVTRRSSWSAASSWAWRSAADSGSAGVLAARPEAAVAGVTGSVVPLIFTMVGFLPALVSIKSRQPQAHAVLPSGRWDGTTAVENVETGGAAGTDGTGRAAGIHAGSGYRRGASFLERGRMYHGRAVLVKSDK